MKTVLVLLSLLFALAQTAWGHASLIETSPPAGAVLAHAPQTVTLTFSEPVGVTAMHLIGPNGKPLPLGPAVDENTHVRLALPAAHAHGTYLLSWRIVSADSHPVGGTLAYAVGAPSAQHASQATSDMARLGAIWLARWLTYLCLFACVGAAFFRILKGAPRQPWTRPVLKVAWILLAVDLGLQGLDLLGAPWSALLQPATWSAALAGTYSWTVGLMALALLAVAAALESPRVHQQRTGAVLALLLSGAAVAASGHAGTAPPEWLSRPLVAAHVMLAIAWIGSLIPLARLVRSAGAPAASADFHDVDARASLAPLASFSRWIAPVVLLLAASGLGLTWLQLDHVSDLWRTAYGRVLVAKLALVAVLLCFAAFNRWRCTRPALAGDRTMQTRLARTTRIEVALVIAILGVVALWRLTPPPRSFESVSAAAATPTFQLQDRRARAEIKAQGAPGQWAIVLTQPNGQPFAAQQVTLIFDNPTAGIEALRGVAQQQAPGHWRATLPPLPPIAGWHVKAEILVNDFKQFTLQDESAAAAPPEAATAMDMSAAHGHGVAHGDHAAGASVQAIRQTPVAPALHVSGCWVRLLPAPAPSAAYFTITNSGAADAALQAAASPAFGSVMLHQTTDQNGVSRMSMSSHLPIPAHGQLVFKPGGYHAMLEQPTGPLAVGDTLALDLLTTDAHHVTATCEVEAATTIRE